MKLGTIAGLVFGLGLAAWLLASYGIGRIAGVLAHAGVIGLLAVVSFHWVQMLFSGWAWWAITPPGSSVPSLAEFVLLRWIREGVNNLLPVAQIGGPVVSARLLQRRGMNLAGAIAGTVADLTIEIVTQVAFTLLGLGLLLHRENAGQITAAISGGVLVAGLMVAGFIAAQWFGLARLIEAAAARLGRGFGWTSSNRLAGLHTALIGCYRKPFRVGTALFAHCVSWLLGGLEIMLILHVLGHDVGLTAGLVIESLGQALKSAGFAVPGALGVQEGGYILVGARFGLGPEVAIALSLLKRLREVVLGAPSLIAWHWLEARSPSAMP